MFSGFNNPINKVVVPAKAAEEIKPVKETKVKKIIKKIKKGTK